MLPSVDVNVSPTRQRALGIPILPQETFLENIFVAQVQTSYTFDFFGAAVLADRALARQVQQQAYQLESTRRALAANIVVAAINAASLQQQVAATEQLAALGEQRARQTAARHRLGSASQDEALAAEQDAANASATLPALRQQLLAVRHAEAVLLGRTPDQAPVPLPLDSLHLPQSVPVSVPSDLLHQRPDILAAEAAVRATADEAGAATAALFPSLTLSASYGRGGFDWSTFTLAGGGDLERRCVAHAALVPRRCAVGAQAPVRGDSRCSRGAIQADGARGIPKRRRYPGVAGRGCQHARPDGARRERRASVQSDTESRYRLGATSFYATLTAGQQYHNASVQNVRARAARLADTAALFQSMGDPPVSR